MYLISKTILGPKWKADRKVITPLYTDKSVGRYHAICVEQANLLVNVLKEKVGPKTFDVELYVHRCGADIINGNPLQILLQSWKQANTVLRFRVSPWRENQSPTGCHRRNFGTDKSVSILNSYAATNLL